MVQRATKFARKSSRHVEVGVLARTSLNPSDHLRAVPLEVLPLLAPFRKRGRLSVRIENLPIQARLSQGRNNGDHSYSLTLDELEDLAYLAPDGTDPHPVLSLRIVALDDGDAATIAVRDLPVDFGTQRDGTIDDEDFRRLIDELAAVKSDLAVREAELAEARLNTAEKTVPSRHLDAELEAARERWQEESAAALARAQRDWQKNEAARLAAAEAKWRAHAESAIETARASSKAVREHGDAIELRRLRDELMAMQTLLAERDDELAQSHAALAKPQGHTSADLDAAIAAACKEWQAAETARFTAAEARWREQADKAHDKGDAELRRLREDLAGATTNLSHRDKELADLRARLRQVQDAAQRETERFAAAERTWQEKSNAALAESRAHAAAALDAALANARLEWKAQEAERLMAAERNWQEQSANAVADARAQSQTSRAAADAEQAHLRGELGVLKTLLAERDAALAEARAATEQARADARARLASAEKSWRAGEAARLSAAEKSLTEKSDAARTDEQAARLCAEAELRALREHVATLETILADRELELTQAIARISASQTEIDSFRENEDISVRRVRGEVAALQASLAERDEELAQARLFAERSYERWQKQAEAERAKAQKAWKADEAARLAAARAQWQDEARKHLEDTLAAERRTAPALPHEGVSALPAAGIEHRPLPEFSPPLLSPSGPPRAAHLSSARDAADEALDRLAKDAYQLLASPPPHNTVRPTDTGIVKGSLTDRRRNGAVKNQSLAPVAAIAAALAAIVVLAALFLWPMLFGAQPSPPVAASAPTEQVEPQVKQALPTAVVLRNVNVRSAPSTSAAILTTLKRGATVAVAERDGIWTRIEPAEGQGAATPGWIVTSAIEPGAQKSSPTRSPAAAPKPGPNVAAVSESPPPPASGTDQAAQIPAESASGAAGGP